MNQLILNDDVKFHEFRKIYVRGTFNGDTNAAIAMRMGVAPATLGNWLFKARMGTDPKCVSWFQQCMEDIAKEKTKLVKNVRKQGMRTFTDDGKIEDRGDWRALDALLSRMDKINSPSIQQIKEHAEELATEQLTVILSAVSSSLIELGTDAGLIADETQAEKWNEILSQIVADTLESE
jgi:hypothetical protein